MDSAKNKKIAIACQGGGSQTAFTAGVLKSIFDNDIHKRRNIIAFSGTSGGAICAALAWYSLVKDGQGDTRQLSKRLGDFWEDIAANNFYDNFLNQCLMNYTRATETGWWPTWQESPSSPFVKALAGYCQWMAPKREFYDFKKILEAHIDFDEIAGWDKQVSPALIIGAANVITGGFKKFTSWNKEISVDSLLASAAVPTIFPAVEAEDKEGNIAAYWDGLFSDNPPIDELFDSELLGANKKNKPDEIWIVQINPQTCDKIPTSIRDIIDRRNEMIGNLSLNQSLERMKLINRYIDEKAFTKEYVEERNYKTLSFLSISMSPHLQKRLDYATKLDRSRKFIQELIKDGEKRGLKIIQKWLEDETGVASLVQPHKGKERILA